jgi:hypothetical protein
MDYLLKNGLVLQEVDQCTYRLTFQYVHVTVCVSKNRKYEVFWVLFFVLFIEQEDACALF